MTKDVYEKKAHKQVLMRKIVERLSPRLEISSGHQSIEAMNDDLFYVYAIIKEEIGKNKT